MKKPNVSRRTLLRTLGVGALLLPLLEHDESFAEPTQTPKRLIVVMQTNGVQEELFHAPGNGGDLTQLQLPGSTEPLMDHRSDLVMMRGLEMKNFTAHAVDHGAGHENFSCALTGVKGIEFLENGENTRFLAGGPSIDQYIAAELAKRHSLPFTSLDLGVMVEHYWFQSRCFYRGADDPVNPEQDPMKAFEALVGGASMPPAELERLRKERRSILDAVGKDLEAFGNKMGSAGKEKIQKHLQSVRDLEKQIQGTGSCSFTQPDSIGDPTENDNYPAVFDQHIDLIVQALACDATRVATLLTNNGNGLLTTLNWLDLPGGQDFGDRNYHGVAHAGGDQKMKCDRWFMERFARLIQKLKEVPEGNGTLLDNTVVLWANHMGNGGAHSSDDLPWILAGRGGGYFKTGQFIRKNNAPTNGVLRALCSAMDVDPSGFGDPAWGDEFPELHT